ncbi:MAG TPA: outer membrane protein assembly factor BamE [Caulobacteraceae bacterium]|jgi:outer membrane protein assembly factor BamE (lipoprotein component of BamABCDE complex)
MSRLPVRSLVLVGAALAASACAPVVGQHGFRVVKAQGGSGQSVDIDPAAIVAGTDTRQTVLARLGSPTLTSTALKPPTAGPDGRLRPAQTTIFDSDTWYYVSQISQRYTYHNAQISQRDVTAIRFTPDQKVAEVRRLDLDDGQQVDMNDRETPTRGRELTILEQLLGNVGRQTLPGSNPEDQGPGQRRPD